jgi:hypothetical protein
MSLVILQLLLIDLNVLRPMFRSLSYDSFLCTYSVPAKKFYILCGSFLYLGMGLSAVDL